ncbi:hypothetical protein ACD661_16445 [Legionella lytica]|uniref:Uncharacterized protein n=1 Tax=Legionella lytica TaxID=96232 RepID=A0ABW8DF21_9GAMM
MSTQNNLYQIKNQLIAIKTHGGHISQYETVLFQLFVDSYKNNYLDLSSCLTADGIMNSLANDSQYQTCPNKTTYDLNDRFSQKWLHWTEAFTMGMQNHYIQWV